MAVVDVLTEITIFKSAKTVSEYAADPANAPAWYDNIESAEPKSPPPLGVGSEATFTAHFMGRRLAYTYRFEEFAAGQRLVMRTAEGPFPMETTYTWESAGNDVTRMTLRNRGEPAGFAKIIAPLMVMAMRRANNKDLAKLKSILEAG